jgi:hypothetical protein
MVEKTIRLEIRISTIIIRDFFLFFKKKKTTPVHFSALPFVIVKNKNMIEGEVRKKDMKREEVINCNATI